MNGILTHNYYISTPIQNPLINLSPADEWGDVGGLKN